MRAHLPNTSRRAVVARRAGLIVTAALVAAMGACGGGSSHSARALLDETFASREPITSGRISLWFALTASGVGHSPNEGLALRLRGPFQSLGPTQLPRFALRVDLRSASVRAAGHVLHAGATATGGRLFIELDGRHFLAPPAAAAALRRGYAEASSGASAPARRSPLATLGLDPGAWLTHPRIAGSGRVAGVDTTHILAGVNAARFLAGARKLFAAGAPLIGAGGGSDALSPALSSSLRSARADVYTGKTDHLLRRLVLRGGTLRLTIELRGLNQPQPILAPSHPQPLSRLPAELQRLGLAPP